MGIKIQRVGSEEEKRIMIGLIIDDQFCFECLPLAKLEFFKLEYARTILGWIQEHHDKYDKAPKDDIDSIFLEKKKSINQSNAKIIETFLSRVSEEHENSVFNSQYQIDLAKRYFKKRHIEVLTKKMNFLLEKDKIEEAAELLETTSEEIEVEDNSSFYNPLDEDEINQFFIGDKTKIILNFDGVLGELIGGIERNNLVVVQGPEKRGKTFWLQQLAFEALHRKLKVIWFSYEMNKMQTLDRFYKQISALSRTPESPVIFPIFDCKKNQRGICKKKERANKINNLLAGLAKDELPIYEQHPRYKECTYCRGTSDYEVATWHSKQKGIKEFNLKNIREKVEGYKTLIGHGNIKIRNYPSFSAGAKEMERDVKFWAKKDFVPDLIISDYLDIQQRDTNVANERDAIWRIWQHAKKMAGIYNCAFLTADQADASARKQKSLDESNFTDDKRKDGILDLKIGLNQSYDEKTQGIMRLNILFKRIGYFNVKREVQVLQCLELGQTMLDSEWI